MSASNFKIIFLIDIWLYRESNWLFYSQYRVILTQIFSNYSESRVEFQFRQWLKFLGQNDSIFLSVYRDMQLQLIVSSVSFSVSGTVIILLSFRCIWWLISWLSIRVTSLLWNSLPMACLDSISILLRPGNLSRGGGGRGKYSRFDSPDLDWILARWWADTNYYYFWLYWLPVIDSLPIETSSEVYWRLVSSEWEGVRKILFWDLII